MRIARTAIQDVLVVERAELGWHCEIDGRRVFVNQRQIAPGTVMPGEGHRGTITLTAEGAEEVRRAIRQA